MKLRTILLPTFALSLVACFITACESENTPTGDDLQISPSYKEIHPGSSVTLTASGADTYTWSLESGGVGGGLSNTKGASVVYMAPSTATSSGTQVITVIGKVSGTQSTNNAFTAQATISVVIPEEKEEKEKEEKVVEDVKISGPTTLSIGSSCVLSATGGEGGYKWSLMNGGNPNCGTLSVTSGAKTSFTALSAGEQQIKATAGKKYDIIIIKCVE